MLHSIINKLLHNKEERRRLLQQRANFAHIVAIAADYGYTEESPEVQAVWNGHSPKFRELILLSGFEESEWRKRFDPAAPQHIEYREGVLVIKSFPLSVSLGRRRWGASRTDIISCYLPEKWEQLCDRIVVGPYETTFFQGEEPIVIFCESGRKMHKDSWARSWNAVEAIRTTVGVEIDLRAVAVSEGSVCPELVVEKIDDEWAWGVR